MISGLCLNSYDTSQYHACGTEWPPDIPQVTRYLRVSSEISLSHCSSILTKLRSLILVSQDKKVIAALHAQDAPRQWSHCDSTVASHFWTPQSVPSIQLFPELLQKVPILLFAGDKDLMCAGLGIEKTIENLEWDGLKGFVSTHSLYLLLSTGDH